MDRVTCEDWKSVARCQCGAMWESGLDLLIAHLGVIQPYCPKCKSEEPDRLDVFKAQRRTETTPIQFKIYNPWTWLGGTESVSYWVTKDGEVLR